jgi:peptide chain release factor subunit 1
MEKSKEYYEFRKQLKFLRAQRGQGTELISVYLQPGANTNDMSDRLRDEYSQAMNIKSKQTRNNVQAAIEKIIQTLKGEHKAPEHGVAIFAGSIDGRMELYSVVPPEPFTVQVYRCDSTFYIDPLQDMIEPKEVFGLFTMDRREATIALLKGKSIKIVTHMTSNVPGKHGKGGQSQLRFERITEILAQDWFKKIAEMMNEVFRDPKIKAIIAGGPGPTKYSFMNEDYLSNEVKAKIKGSIDTSYTDEFGIKEVADRSSEVIKELEISAEKDLVNKFLKEAVTSGLAAYGIKEVKEALGSGKASVLLLSEKLSEEQIIELSELAEKIDAKIEMVSVETPEGEQFYIGFHGIGAFLRYK